MTVDVVAENRLVDIIEAGFDAGFRLREVLPRDMIVVPVGPNLRSAVVGSIACFELHPKPRIPADYLRHRCIRMRFGRGGRRHTVPRPAAPRRRRLLMLR